MALTINQLFLNDDPNAFAPPEIGATIYIYNIPDLRAFV